MNEKAKSRSRRQPGTGQAETAAGMAHDSYSDFTTPPARRQVPRLIIADILPDRRENALKLPELKRICNLDGRTVRAMIQRERKNYPILTDNRSGYWISYDPDEVRRFCHSMRHRARQVWATARAVEKSAGLVQREPLDGQFDLFGGDGG